MCHVWLFDYYEISEWAPEYGPRLSELGLERYRAQEISRKKLGSCSLWSLASIYDWTIMDGQGIDSKDHVWFKDFDCVHLP